MKILIIDDDQDVIDTTSTLLKYKGYEAFGADTIEEGIELIGKIEPQIILLDIMFPEKTTMGFEAADKIKKMYPEIPIFALSSINEEYAFNFSKTEAKTDEFLSKPINIDLLIELIEKYNKQKKE